MSALIPLIWRAHHAYEGIDTFAWSPDQQKILVSFGCASNRSAIVTLNSGTTASGYPAAASFQPGGQLILGIKGFPYMLGLTDMAGNQVRVLATSTGEPDSSPYVNDLGLATWSSNGQMIYYEYQDGIWRINVDGPGAQQVIAGTQLINDHAIVQLDPELSPDGVWLLYLEASGDNTPEGTATEQWHLAQPDGSGALALPQSASSEAVWRPKR
jgi:hypothetical protein